jgi:Uma2 family endonuclease
MASSTTSETLAPRDDAQPARAPAGDAERLKVYDRSSLRGDFMVTIPDQSEEDFFLYAPEKRFCEFIDGVIYMPSPVGVRHQEVLQFLFLLLDGYFKERDRRKVLTGPAVLKLRPGRNFEPDIFVLPVEAAARGQIRKHYCTGPATLIVEVLSESTRFHDLEYKTILYREDATDEIWLVDGQNRLLLVERRVGEGYQTRQIEAGLYRSSAIPSFWIDVSWLWANPLPDYRRCLKMILAGPPA